MPERDGRPVRILQPLEPLPGLMQLEEDNAAPLLHPEHMLAMALNAKGKLEAQAQHLDIMVGHLTTVACALIQMLRDNPHTAHLVSADGTIVIPNELSNRVTGAQIEAVTTSDGDVGITVRERAPELFVKGGRS